MPKRFEISADSPADLNPALAARYSVTSVPLTIHIDGREYKDGVDITPAQMFKLSDTQKTVPKTSAVPVGDYMDVFTKLTADETEVLHISLGSKISSTHQNAVLAAQEMQGVHVVDSDNLSCGISLLVYEAAALREAGFSAAETAAELERIKSRVVTGFVIDTLEYLRRGGRCSTLEALGANLLGIKPSIEMSGGVLHVAKKYRGKSREVQLKFIGDILAQKENIEPGRAVLCQTGVNPDDFSVLKQTIEATLGGEIITAQAGCTISAHCGPNCLGFMYLSK